jgi:hypothetical protein
MHAGFRTPLIAVAGVLAAVVVGAQIAAGQHVLATLAAGLLVVVLLEWLGGARTEALILGFLFAGYMIGNRGFAQITPLGGSPLFFGELGLAAATVLVLARSALVRQLPLERDWLNRAVLFWIAIGSLRIWYDVRTHGFAAVRDFATIYYAVYFFAAQSALRDERSYAWFRRCAFFAAGVLPVVSALYSIFPDFFLQRLVWREVPLIYFKDDLVATFLFGGALLLMAGERSRTRLVFAVAALGSGLSWLSRAGMLSLGVATAAWAWARRWRPLQLGGAAVLGGLIIVMAQAVLGREQFTDTKAYAIYEHLVSIVDVGGHRTYRNPESTDTGDNNRYRLVWWRMVAAETWRENPWLGLGFGHDLAAGFLVEYGLASDDRFNARSPHSIVFTLLGRLGAAGLSMFAVLVVALVSSARPVLLGLKQERWTGASHIKAQEALGWWSFAAVIFISACFGVVLEGPMGAVLFWISLGCANRVTRDLLDGQYDEDEAPQDQPIPSTETTSPGAG